MTDKTEATRLADALTSVVQTYPQMGEDEPGGYCSEVDQVMDEAAALLRQWPEGEPVALESVHLTRDTRGMCVVRVNGRVAIRDNGDIIDHMATLEWFAAPPAAPAPVVPMQTSDLWRKGMAEKRAQASEIDKALSAAPVVPDGCCRNELLTALYSLASNYENALGMFGQDGEGRRKAEGDLAHAMQVAAKHNRNGPRCAAPAMPQPMPRTADCLMCGHCAATGERVVSPAMPLTDEQLARIAVEDEFLLYCDQDSFNEIARAIEAAHGITGASK